MKNFSFQQLALAAALLAATSTLSAAEKTAYGIDQDTGLVMAPGWELVKANCTVCHSARFITGQRGDRATWESMIRWMQKTQGLWPIPAAMETTILDYLASTYPPGKQSRRPNLPPSLLPAKH